MAIFGDFFASCIFGKLHAVRFRNKKRKKERNIKITGQKYNGLPYYIERS